MEFSEKALVLKVGRFREADLWLRLLTPGKGIFTVLAFGGSRSRRRFCGCLDPLNELSVHVREGKGGRYLQLMEADLISSYPGIRSDFARLGAAVNCFKFAEAIQAGRESAEDSYRLLSEAMRELEVFSSLSNVLPWYFRAKLTFDQGYRPNLSTCLVCGQHINRMTSPHFWVERGGIACRHCCHSRATGLAVCKGTLKTLEYLAENRPESWGKLHLSSGVRRQCFEIVDRFVEYHLGLAWERFGFRRI